MLAGKGDEQMTEKILIPLDGTAEAEQTVPFVAEVTKAGGFAVSLLSIIDPGELDVTETAGEGVLTAHDTGTGGGGGMDLAHEGAGGTTGMVWMAEIGSPSELSADEAKALDEARQSARDYLSGVEKKLADINVEAEVLIGFGNPDREITEEAIKAGATMIAMSSRSGMFWEQGVLGTTTDRTIHASPMPVLVFKPMEGLAHSVTVNPGTVVIAVDGSDQSERSIAPAVKLAGEIGARVTLVHAVKRERGKQREQAEAYLASLADKIGGEVETGVVSGDAAEEVILFADRFDHPMIVVAEHGGISLGRWLRGSTTDKIIRNAGYPVLVIPAE